MGFSADFVKDIVTGKSITSAGDSYELGQAIYRPRGLVRAVVTAAASLVDAFLLLEMQIDAGTWVGAPQKVTLVAVDSGTPDILNANTASTTGVVGGVGQNILGITDIDDNGTFLFTYDGYAFPMRLRWGCTSGTGTLAIEHRGFVAYP